MPDVEFEVLTMRMLTGLEKTVEDLSGTINRERENIKKNQSGLKNSITKI